MSTNLIRGLHHTASLIFATIIGAGKQRRWQAFNFHKGVGEMPKAKKKAKPKKKATVKKGKAKAKAKRKVRRKKVKK
jgi:hypothetical protein